MASILQIIFQMNSEKMVYFGYNFVKLLEVQDSKKINPMD